MPQGLQVFDENGLLVADITDRFGRILGRMNMPADTGTIAWPYPGVQGLRVASVVSVLPAQPGLETTAYAYYNNGVVYYSKGDDRARGQILFMIY